LVIRARLKTGEAAGEARLAPAHTKFNRRVTNVRSGDRFRTTSSQPESAARVRR
jgi:hypothetical protein